MVLLLFFFFFGGGRLQKDEVQGLYVERVWFQKEREKERESLN